MKNKIKQITKILSLSVLLTALAFSVSSCGSEKEKTKTYTFTDTDISFDWNENNGDEEIVFLAGGPFINLSPELMASKVEQASFGYPFHIIKEGHFDQQANVCLQDIYNHPNSYLKNHLMTCLDLWLKNTTDKNLDEWGLLQWKKEYKIYIDNPSIDNDILTKPIPRIAGQIMGTFDSNNENITSLIYTHAYLNNIVLHPEWAKIFMKISKTWLDKTMNNVEKEIDKLLNNNKKVVIMGSSWGSWQAHYLIQHRPEFLEKVQGLVDLAGTIGPNNEEWSLNHKFINNYQYPFGDDNSRYWTGQLQDQSTNIGFMTKSNPSDPEVNSPLILQSWIRNMVVSSTLINTSWDYYFTDFKYAFDPKGLDNKEVTFYDYIKNMTDQKQINLLKEKWNFLVGGKDVTVGLLNQNSKDMLDSKGIIACFNPALDHHTVQSDSDIKLVYEKFFKDGTGFDKYCGINGDNWISLNSGEWLTEPERKNTF